MLVAVLIAVLLVSADGRDALASVTLRHFGATLQADGAVLVRWETASEVDTVAFRLHRSKDVSMTGEVLAMLPPQGDPGTGASYATVDRLLVSGREYYYRPEEIDLYGGSSWFGPVTVRAGSGGCRVYLPLLLSNTVHFRPAAHLDG